MKLLGWTLDLQRQWKKPPLSLHELSFFDKIEGCVLQGCSFIKTLVHCRLFFLKKQLFLSFSKQLLSGTFSENNLWWILFIAKLQSKNCRLITLLKETPSQELLWQFFNQLFFAIDYFSYISICCEEATYMKDYMKARL